jgi:hypothetical protein
MGGGGGGGGFRGTKGGRRRKQHGKAPMNNQAQNKQSSSVAKEFRLTPAQRERLHREISGKGYGYQTIREIAKDLFGK